MDNSLIVLSGVIVIWVIINLMVTSRIKKADYKDKEREKLHLLIIWILPVLGLLITRFYWKKPSSKIEVITKKDRKGDSGGFYDSGYGMFGGSD